MLTNSLTAERGLVNPAVLMVGCGGSKKQRGLLGWRGNVTQGFELGLGKKQGFEDCGA